MGPGLRRGDGDGFTQYPHPPLTRASVAPISTPVGTLPREVPDRKLEALAPRL
jgi:hypothetical protein